MKTQSNLTVAVSIAALLTGSVIFSFALPHECEMATI
jgi:uncharacterized membrane protein